MQTALANVNDNEEGNLRVLFDSGSHRSFISAKTVEKLGIKAFGSKVAEECKRDLEELYLVPVRGEKKKVN